MHYEDQRTTIRDCIIRVVQMEDIMARKSMVNNFRVGTPSGSLGIKAILVGLFRKYFRFFIEVILILVTIVVRVTANPRGVHNLDLWSRRLLWINQTF